MGKEGRNNVDREFTDGWQDLRNAIIMQAVEDWQQLILRKTATKPNCNCGEIEQFLKSDWCDWLLSDMPISGKDILTVLQGYKEEHGKKKPESDPEENSRKVQFFNGWSRFKIKYFVRAHSNMKKETVEGEAASGYKHEFEDGQTYEVRFGDFMKCQPTEIYINGELAERHKY